jgi:hypothetical protein
MIIKENRDESEKKIIIVVIQHVRWTIVNEIIWNITYVSFTEGIGNMETH